MTNSTEYATKGFMGALGVGTGLTVASILVPVVIVLLLCGSCFACSMFGSVSTGTGSTMNYDSNY